MTTLKRSECSVLHIGLKGHWYRMIESGVKKIEFREATPYWQVRISHDRFTPAYYLHGVNFRLPRAVSACSGANSREAARGSRPQYQQLDLFGSVA
jgi:hypothetical protein